MQTDVQTDVGARSSRGRAYSSPFPRGSLAPGRVTVLARFLPCLWIRESMAALFSGGKAFRPGWGEGVSCREAGSSPAVLKTLKASLLPLCWEVDVQCWIESWGLWGGAGAGEAAGVGGEEWGS